ncbi:MAG: hypothetical protein GY865_03390, partial [candidate division Zixibacteria bacterium]|nr:hypothetical protein [candidate division Zixibacteria bacterium]
MNSSRRISMIVFASVIVLFVISWIIKIMVLQEAGAEGFMSIRDAFLVTFAAFLTLAIFSFLYKDNPYYKFAEHLFVGISAAYWMCVGFWSTFVGNFIPKVSGITGLSEFFEVPPKDFEIHYFVPLILGMMLLMRLSPKGGWLSRWSLAFIVGTTAGLNLIRYLRTDFITQISNTFIPLLVDWKGIGPFFSDFSLSASGQFVMTMGNWVIF